MGFNSAFKGLKVLSVFVFFISFSLTLNVVVVSSAIWNKISWALGSNSTQEHNIPIISFMRSPG